MADFELIMPKMGESIAEATIIKWLKNEGDVISVDESVLEIATDKVDSEVPSTKAGVLKKKLFNENDVVPVGAAIAVIEVEGSVAQSAGAPEKEQPTVVAPPANNVVKSGTVPAATAASATGSGTRFYSPLVLNIARTE